jgi:tripartite-type tricarboxylate transporter receptor subunit TctC
MAKVLRSPEVGRQLAAQGVDPVANTPEEFAAIIKNDIEKSAKVIKAAGIKTK